jgi:hypothetical protein
MPSEKVFAVQNNCDVLLVFPSIKCGITAATECVWRATKSKWQIYFEDGPGKFDQTPVLFWILQASTSILAIVFASRRCILHVLPQSLRLGQHIQT